MHVLYSHQSIPPAGNLFERRHLLFCWRLYHIYIRIFLPSTLHYLCTHTSQHCTNCKSALEEINSTSPSRSPTQVTRPYAIAFTAGTSYGKGTNNLNVTARVQASPTSPQFSDALSGFVASATIYFFALHVENEKGVITSSAWYASCDDSRKGHGCIRKSRRTRWFNGNAGCVTHCLKFLS